MKTVALCSTNHIWAASGSLARARKPLIAAHVLPCRLYVTVLKNETDARASDNRKPVSLNFNVCVLNIRI